MPESVVRVFTRNAVEDVPTMVRKLCFPLLVKITTTASPKTDNLVQQEQPTTTGGRRQTRKRETAVHLLMGFSVSSRVASSFVCFQSLQYNVLLRIAGEQ